MANAHYIIQVYIIKTIYNALLYYIIILLNVFNFGKYYRKT